MKLIKKSTKWILMAVFVIIIVASITFGIVFTYGQPDKEKTEKCFQQDGSDLRLIADYLANSEYDFICIDASDIKKEVMFTGHVTDDQKIDDKAVLKALKRLLKYGKYKEVRKSYDTVVFEKWHFFEQERGIATPVDKEKLPVVEYLILSEPLSEKGWYYYQADYEEWRS